MATKKTTVKPPTTADTAAKLIAAAEAMKTFPDSLPAVTSVSHYTVPERFHLRPVNWTYSSWRAVAGLLPWADHFDVPLYVALSSFGGRGEVTVSFTVHDVVFELDASIGTSEAYQLGGVMNRPLTRDKALTVTAAEMRSALTLIGGA